jgi:hypothetical protein
MPVRKNLKAIPKFESEDEERAFWATHDSIHYLDWAGAKCRTYPVSGGRRSLQAVCPAWPKLL